MVTAFAFALLMDNLSVTPLSVAAQSLPFAGSETGDSKSLARVMNRIAAALCADHPGSLLPDSLDQLCCIEIVAGEYDAAARSIVNIRACASLVVRWFGDSFIDIPVGRP